MAGKSEHRKKRKVRVDQNSPFPVPISTLTFVSSKSNYWFYYTGNLKDDHVEVSHSGDIHFLYKMGFFGRGLLSRGAPELLQNLPNVHIPTPVGETDVLKVMRKRMYLRHKQWQKADETTADENSGTVPDSLAEFDSDIDYTEYTEQYEQDDVPDQTSDRFHGDNAETGMEIEEFQENETDDVKGPFEETEASWDDNDDADIDFWNTDNHNEIPKAVVADEWENKEADHDFWGTSDNTTTNQETHDKTTANQGTQDKSTANQGTQNKTSANQGTQDNITANQGTQDKTNANQSVSEHMKVDSNDLTNEQFDNNSENHRNAIGPYIKNENFHSYKHVVDSSQNEMESCSPSKRLKTCDGKSGTTLNVFKQTDSEMNVDDQQDLESNSKHLSHSDDSMQVIPSSPVRNTQTTESTNIDTQTLKGINTNDIVSVKSTSFSKSNSQEGDDIADKPDMKGDNSSHSNSHDTVKTDISDVNSINNNPNNKNDASDIGDLPYHSCCMDEDANGDYVVIDDSDCDDRHTNVPIKKSWRWKPVRKKDVYPYMEPLILSLEEAFFLSYGLGCLTVKDEVNTALSLSTLWCQCCDRKQGFLPSYVAYHYFRSKGWVPKSGVTFGVDFIVYREGPPFYHSSYSVIIKTVYEGDYKEVADFNNRQLTWTSFAGLNRVTEHVAKTLMLCYVIMPREVTKEELRSPKCLSKFKIQLQLVKRWVSSQEREKDKDQEMP